MTELLQRVRKDAVRKACVTAQRIRQAQLTFLPKSIDNLASCAYNKGKLSPGGGIGIRGSLRGCAFMAWRFESSPGQAETSKALAGLLRF